MKLTQSIADKTGGKIHCQQRMSKRYSNVAHCVCIQPELFETLSCRTDSGKDQAPKESSSLVGETYDRYAILLSTLKLRRRKKLPRYKTFWNIRKLIHSTNISHKIYARKNTELSVGRHEQKLRAPPVDKTVQVALPQAF